MQSEVSNITTNSQSKARARKKFTALENVLRNNLAGNKAKIIRKVREKTVKKEKRESIFKKYFLTPVLDTYFKDYPIRIIVEGVDSKGGTRLKNMFFGSQPLADFFFKSKRIEATLFSPTTSDPPFPLNTVGEVKYDKLNFHSFVTGIGQIIGYRAASRLQDKEKQYGYYIFFNINLEKSIDENAKQFLEELWEKEDIFVVII